MEMPVQPKALHLFYPFLAGLFFGLLQTGLFFQLSFALSSGFTTFLMVTLCWLLGSAIGLYLAREGQVRFTWFLGLGLLAYWGCILLLKLAPFQTQFWPVYAFLIMVMGLVPGVFFARMAAFYSARALFFHENNGFIAGLIGGTLLFLVLGRMALWLIPALTGGVMVLVSRSLLTKKMP